MLEKTVDVKEVVAEARRTQILQGATQVFAEKGYHKSTTKQIAKAAGVSEGTIYNYFKNKRELLFALLKTIGTQPLAEIFSQHDKEPRDVLQQFIQNRFTLVQNHGASFLPILAELFTDVNLRGQFFDQMILPIAIHTESYFQAQIDMGRFRPFDVRIVTRALIGGMIMNTAMGLTGVDTRGEPINPDQMIEQLIDIFLHGVENPNYKP